jgi:hypothetical protein
LRADCAPETLTREEAAARLRALVPNSPPGAVASVVRDARAWLRGNEKWPDIGDREINKQIAAALAAHVRWLDAQGAPPVEVFVPPEPTLADVLASNEALRGEVAGLRADFRALMKAIEAGGQLRLFPVAA